MTKNIKNKTLEISADIAAIVGSPKAPAIRAMIKKMKAHINIIAP